MAVNYHQSLLTIITMYANTVPASPPASVQAESRSSNEILVAWNEVPLIDQNGDIITYEVQYIPATVSDSLNSFINTSNLTLLLTNLEEFVAYNISVRAYTSIGPGPYSVPVISMTMVDGKLECVCVCVFKCV